MFFKKKIDLNMIDPTSKITLKMSCLRSCGGDIDKAQKLYDFMIKDTELPDFPAPRPTVMQQVQDAINGTFGWLDQNGDKLMKGYNMIQAIRGNAGVQAAEQAAESLPPLPPITPQG